MNSLFGLICTGSQKKRQNEKRADFLFARMLAVVHK